MGLKSSYEEYIALSRYARWIDKENRRETWEETVERLITFWEGRFPKYKSILREEIQQAIFNTEVMPSMRSLMTAGKALDRDEVAGFNCSYVAVDHPRVFNEILYVLCCGTGLGFSAERQYITKLPEVAESFIETDTVIVVRDSKIGWANAFKELISMLYQGSVPTWDISRVRPAGAKLKTFGGRASGPQPLVDLFEFSVEMFKKAKGRKLNSLEVHDLVCKIADIVVVGGVRRSALISLSNLSDPRMRDAKSGQWWIDNPQRALANNSVCYTEKPDIGIFMEEWKALYDSKSGERGIFNREAANRLLPERRANLGYTEWGCNPCLHPDSLVETVEGRVRIADIIEPTLVYTMLDDGTLGVRKASAAWKTKEGAETINITTAANHTVRCTPDHKIFTMNRGWVEAKDIQIGDNLVHLKRSRRGSGYSGVGITSDPTGGRDNQVMEHRLVYEAVYGKLQDGYDVHHIDEDTYNNSIDNLEAMLHEDHSTHTRNSCDNNHMNCGYNADGNWRFLPTDSGYKKPIKPMPLHLKSNLVNQFSTKVVTISKGDTVDVYDLTVEDTHNFIADFTVVHNCSEIVLRSKQFCNLTEVIIRTEDDLDELKRKVRLAAILGTMQASLTNFRYLSSSWKQNTEEEALLGVSLTGIMDSPAMSGDYDKTFTDPSHGGKIQLPKILEELRDVAIDTNKEWSSKLGVNVASAITAVKPSGTVSQLVDSSSGIHPRYSDYYIRTIRADNKDPLCQMMKDQGFPCEEDVMKPDSGSIFSFPIKAPEGSVMRDDMTALEQCEVWKTYQLHWCEHKPSITVYVKENEWLQVGSWVYDNFDIVSGISFLPHSDHSYKQAPYQEISKEEYEESVSLMPQVDWSRLGEYEKDDTTINMRELACVAGSCEI